MQAMEIFPDYKYNHLNIANVQIAMGEYKEAIESYNKFLALYPDHQESRESLAGAF